MPQKCLNSVCILLYGSITYNNTLNMGNYSLNNRVESTTSKMECKPREHRLLQKCKKSEVIICFVSKKKYLCPVKILLKK